MHQTTVALGKDGRKIFGGGSAEATSCILSNCCVNRSITQACWVSIKITATAG